MQKRNYGALFTVKADIRQELFNVQTILNIDSVLQSLARQIKESIKTSPNSLNILLTVFLRYDIIMYSLNTMNDDPEVLYLHILLMTIYFVMLELEM